MPDFKFRILTVAAIGVFLLSGLLNPAFAASTIYVEASSNSNSNVLSFGEDFPFGEGNFGQFFSSFFGRKLRTGMDGAQEVPGPGDIDGTGEASVKLKQNSGELCIEMKVDYVEKAAAAHIHHAPEGSAGAVVVVLPTPDSGGEAEGCVEVDPNLLKAIKENSQDYYINIHTTAYPDGAIRGQLSR